MIDPEGSWRRLVLRACRDVAENIRAYELADPDGGVLPEFTAGAHLQVRLGNGLIRQYSLANDPRARERYLLGILRDPGSRGGSAYIHENWTPGTLVEVSQPRNLFPLSGTASSHLLIAGGIGITPILAMVHELAGRNAAFSLHYCTRRPATAAFKDVLAHMVDGEALHFIHDEGDPKRGLDLHALLTMRRAEQHVYVCGPAGLIEATRAAAAHWPADAVHFESFGTGARQGRPDADDTPFEVELARSGAVYTVAAGCSILDVLGREGHDLPSLCRQGYCGSCLVEIRDGTPEHRDTVLTEEEKAENKLIALCCSRAKSRRLVLDL